MNDLVKEFARQAGFKVNWQHEDVQAIKMAQYKEFAELIVRECMSYMKDGDIDFAKFMIKRNFGVEE
jgi:nucleoside 2-deoxyribosyltransferase